MRESGRFLTLYLHNRLHHYPQRRGRQADTQEVQRLPLQETESREVKERNRILSYCIYQCFRGNLFVFLSLAVIRDFKQLFSQMYSGKHLEPAIKVATKVAKKVATNFATKVAKKVAAKVAKKVATNVAKSKK